jgi:hypothetical protein
MLPIARAGVTPRRSESVGVTSEDEDFGQVAASIHIHHPVPEVRSPIAVHSHRNVQREGVGAQGF